MIRPDDMTLVQPLDEAKLLRIIPKNAIEAIVETLQASDDPIRDATTIRDFLFEVIQQKGTKRVTAEFKDVWDILGEDPIWALNELVEGFIPNTIQKVAAWLGVIGLVCNLLASDPEQKITVNNIFIIQSQTSMETYVQQISGRYGNEI